MLRGLLNKSPDDLSQHDANNYFLDRGKLAKNSLLSQFLASSKQTLKQNEF
jgi:hypothetical protein